MPTTSTAVAVGLASTRHSRPRVILCQSAAIGRRDYAVRTPSVTIDNVDWRGDLRLCHRYDTLVYRTVGGEMTWGTNSESLDDWDSDNAYQTLDLTGLDLPYGQVYKITAAAYAAEIP